MDPISSNLDLNSEIFFGELRESLLTFWFGTLDTQWDDAAVFIWVDFHWAFAPTFQSGAANWGHLDWATGMPMRMPSCAMHLLVHANDRLIGHRLINYCFMSDKGNFSDFADFYTVLHRLLP
jgi:hypothetical protein